jgi:hypothetical protein
MTRAAVDGVTYFVGPLECPRCRTRVHSVDGYGVLRPKCQTKQCRLSWIAVRLPPGSDGKLLIDLYGIGVARAIMVALSFSFSALSDDELAKVKLVRFDGPVYVQHPIEYARGNRGNWSNEQSRAFTELDGGLAWPKVKGVFCKLLGLSEAAA